MPKQLNVNMKFNADVGSAKAALLDLQKSLDQIITGQAKGSKLPLTKELTQATQAAAQLKVQLMQATDVNTGKLSLSKFNQQLQQSGMSIQKYGQELAKLGPTGQQAFSQLTQSLATANLSFNSTTGLVNKLWVSLKNTARWQISSSMLKKLYTGISTAFNYAKDLNESLTNIRIVTGESTEKMAEFAVQANKAAKALSASTLAYTNASLIYYRQGLSDEEVAKRTETTIKMSNVTDQSAENVSDQMTAIWNNFAKGADNLEYFADVITKLGATTASSSDEIAQGLSKFAAVADTVGLSYEKAAAALATVVAETRQSADTVGTAFKTIFARLESLSLGETLKDDVGLTKYTEALAKVGVSVLDQNNQLRSMDNILDDLGTKWEGLTESQKVATAETIAGVRQYAQFMALMNNYDKILANQNVAAGSGGTLQEQADIYAESWEAASKRVKASAESIYSSLLNDKFFINFNNGLADVLTGIDKFIKSMGGAKGLLLTLGSIFMGVFQDQMVKSLDNLMLHFTPLSTQIKQQQKMLTEAAATMRTMVEPPDDPTKGGTKMITFSQKQQYAAQMKEYEMLNTRATVFEETGKAALAYSVASEHMTDSEKLVAEEMLRNNQILGERIIKLKEAALAANENAEAAKKSLLKDMRQTAKKNPELTNPEARSAAIAKATSALNDYEKSVQSTIKNSQGLEEISTKVFNAISKSSDKESFRKAIGLDALNGKSLEESLKQIFGEAFTNLDLDQQGVLRQKFLKILDSFGEGGNIEAAKAKIQELFEDPGSTVLEEKTKALQTALEGLGYSEDAATEAIQIFKQALQDGATFSEAYGRALEQLRERCKNVGEGFGEAGQKVASVSQAITIAGRAFMSIGMVVNQVKNIISTFNDENATMGDKIMSLVTGFGMLAPAIMGLIPAYKAYEAAAVKAGVTASAAMWQLTLIIAAVAALIALIAFVATQEDATEKKAKEAKKAAEDMKKEEDKAREAAEKLKDTINGYDEAVKKLQECTRGTEEWKEALENVNQAALDILNNIGNIDLKELGYNSLSDTYNKTGGYIEFNDGVLDQLQQQADSRVNQLSYATSLAEGIAAQANADLLRKTLSEAIIDTGHYVSGQGEVDTSDFDAQRLEEYLKQNADSLVEMTAEEFANEVKQFGNELNFTNSQAEQYQEQLRKLTDSAAAAADKLALISELQVDEILGDQYSETSKDFASQQAEDYAQRREKYWEELLTSNSGQQIWTGKYDENGEKEYETSKGINKTSKSSNEIYQAALAALQEAGYNLSAANDNAVMGTDANRTFRFSNNKGDYEEYTAKQVAAMISASEGLAQVADSAQEAANVLSGLSGSGVEFADALIQGAYKDGEGNRHFNFESLIGEQTGDELYKNVANLQNLDLSENGDGREKLEEIFGISYEKISQLAQQYGVTVEQIVEDYLNSANNMVSFSEKQLSELSKFGDISSWTQSQKHQISNKRVNLSEKEDLNTSDLSEIDSELQGSPDKLIEFYDGLSEISLTSDEATTKIKELAESVGLSEEATQHFVDKINAIPKTFDVSTKNIEESKAALDKIISEGLKNGDNISAEDLKVLSNAGVNVNQYFTKMADGTYTLTGKAEEFNAVVNRININKLEEKVKKFGAAQENISADVFDTSKVERKATKYVDSSPLSVYDSTQSLAQDRLDYLNSFGEGTFDDKFNDKQIELLSNYHSAVQEGTSGSFLEGLDADQFQQIAEMIDLAKEKQSELEAQFLSSATSLQQLKDMASGLSESLGGYNESAYGEALIGLASQYDNTAQEIEDYQNALQTSDVAQIEAARSALELATSIGEASEKYSLEAKDVETQAKLIAEEYKISGEAAANLAIKNQRLNKGVAALNKDFSDWNKTLTKADKKSADYAEALNNANDALADLTGALSGADIPLKFLDRDTDSGRKHLDLMAQAAKGDTNAINQLGNELAYAQIEALEFNDAITSLVDENGNQIGDIIDVTEFKSAKDIVLQGIDDLHNKLGELEDGANVGDILGNNWVNALNQMAIATGMSVEQMRAYLNELGVETNVTSVPVTQKTRVPIYTTEESVEVIDPGGVTNPQNPADIRPATYRKTSKTWQTGSAEVEETIDVAQINVGDAAGTPPSITYRGASGGGGVSPSSTGGGKGGGGGGGGGGKERKAKEPKKASDEIERYHKIDKTIDSLSKQYDKLSAAKDKAFGPARLRLIDQENALLQQQTKAEQARLEEVEKYYADDRSAIEAYGAIIDENGVISNYDDIMKQELDRLNAAYEEYNAGGLSDEIIEAKEKEYEEFKKILEQFEETNSEYLDQLQKVEEAIRVEITAELERIQAKVEVQLELPEHQIKMIEFKLSRLEDKSFKSGERIALWSEELEKVNDEYKVIYNSIEEILALQDENGDWSGLGMTEEQAQRLLAGDQTVLDEIKVTGENAGEIMEALLEKETELQDKYTQMADYMKSIEEELINQLDEYNEAIEKQISKMEKLGSIAQAMKDTINAVGKEVIGIPASVMRSINNNILKSSEARANAYKAEYEAQTKALIAAREALGKAQTEEDKKYWQDMIDTTEEAMNDAKESMLEQIQDYAEQAATIFEETLTESLANMGKNIYGMTVEDAQTAFDRYTTLSEDFLQDYQKIYELSKMTRSIEASINNTDNLKAKQTLRDLQKEINQYQAEGVQMTQYEVDYLNKKYELRLAEIALEDAQNAKDQVRLSRNADGGWGYVYTANQQNIDQAQQNYEDKLKEIQDLNYQIIQETQSGILALQQEFRDALSEIWKKDLSEEERKKQLTDLTNFYRQRYRNLTSKLDTSLGFNNETYDFWSTYGSRYGKAVSAANNYIDTYNETFLGGLNPAITSGAEMYETWSEQLGDISTPGTILGDSYISWAEYSQDVTDLFSSIAEEGETTAEAIERQMNEMSVEIDNTTDSVTELAEQMGEELPAAMRQVEIAQQTWSPVMEDMADLIENVMEAMSGLIDKMNEYNEIELNPLDIPDSSGISNRYVANVAPSSGGGGSGGGTGGTNSTGPRGSEDDKKTTYSSGATLLKITFKTPWVGSPNSQCSFNAYDPGTLKDYVLNYYNTHKETLTKYRYNLNPYVDDVLYTGLGSANSFLNYVRKLNPSVSFDTGGYTGDFGPQGKLAMLHEKELVLNKQDTLNMLRMVALARDALGQVSLGSSLIAQTAASGYAVGQTGGNMQNITIDAHFPNVTDHNEIEQAFNNLANYAAQNAYNYDLPQRVNLF